MSATQLLLFPDPRPLVERLGREFFRQLPDTPGVYVMRDASNAVLYVGKAKNLRKRLGSYRVANPDRMPRRHSRLLRAVARIDLETQVDESAALARESQLLRNLKPPFNRAGTWPSSMRFLSWRATDGCLELAVADCAEPAWNSCGPLSGGADALRTCLARVLRLALQPERGIAGLPAGWIQGKFGDRVLIPCGPATDPAQTALRTLFNHDPASFCDWVRSATNGRLHPFEQTLVTSDLEHLAEFFAPSAAD